MAPRAPHALAIASVGALLAIFAPVAAADDLTTLLGTTVINNVLTGIALPQVPVPDPETGEPTQTSTQPQQSQPEQPQPQSAPAQTSTPAAPAHPPGYYCKGESKRHVRGARGTPFSRCVSAMGRLDDGSVASPAEACTGLSHKRFPGMKRTPFSVCVAGGRQLLADRQTH